MKLTYRQAAELLAERDPVIARLVEAVGLPQIGRPSLTPIEALVWSITSQQIATAAARAIHGRLVEAIGGMVTAEAILATSVEKLRGAGLSGNKATSIIDLATKVTEGALALEPRRLARMGDEEVAAQLTTVRGIGKWSADIFLMFQLRRMDIWPTGDLAVRKGYALAWGVPVPTAKQLDVLGEGFRPYRSVAAWYCWAAVREGVTPPA